MTIHLRQICLVARELDPVVSQLTKILDVRVCHSDPAVQQYGLENVLIPIGTDFLEVVAPIEANTAAERYLDRLGRNGGYMVITQVDSEDTQQAIRSRAIAARVRVAHEDANDSWSCCQLHPADMEAAFLDVEWDAEVDYIGYWHPAGGHKWREFVNIDNPIKLKEVELQAFKPQALTRLWQDILGTGVVEAECEINLANAKICFTEKPSESYSCLSGLTLKVKDKEGILDRAIEVDCFRGKDWIEICGTQFYLQD